MGLRIANVTGSSIDLVWGREGEGEKSTASSVKCASTSVSPPNGDGRENPSADAHLRQEEGVRQETGGCALAYCIHRSFAAVWQSAFALQLLQILEAFDDPIMQIIELLDDLFLG